MEHHLGQVVKLVGNYGMEVKDNVLYGVDAVDYTSNGMILSYSLSSNEVTNFADTGIIPGGIYFN